jgi:hypothetical protein
MMARICLWCGVLFPGSTLLRWSWWSAWLWDTRLCLLHLKIVNDSLHSIDGTGVVRCRPTLNIRANISAQRHHAICGLHTDLPALNAGVTVDLILHVTRNVGVCALRLP